MTYLQQAHLNELLSLLQRKQQLLQDMNPLLEAQAHLVISNAIEPLKANTQAVRLLAKQLAKLELQRLQLWQTAQWAETFTLTTLLAASSLPQNSSNLAPVDLARLLELQQSLVSLAEAMAFYKTRNQRLLEASISWVKDTIEAFSKAQQQQEAFATAYGAQGKAN